MGGMTATALAKSACPIARSLSVLGEKWTLLVVREALWGRTRFADFRANLGIAPDVLADRLQTLVEAGILARRPYREEGQREREEYVLTTAGRELLPVLAALAAWGNEHRESSAPLRSAHVEIAT
jgi:DNA-binding HxlR family transcriptional regulator